MADTKKKPAAPAKKPAVAAKKAAPKGAAKPKAKPAVPKKAPVKKDNASGDASKKDVTGKKLPSVPESYLKRRKQRDIAKRTALKTALTVSFCLLFISI